VANPEQNKKLVREAFDTLFKPTRTTRARKPIGRRTTSSTAHISQPGRDGLFDFWSKSLPHTLRHETELVMAEGDLVMLRGRFSGHGQPARGSWWTPYAYVTGC